MEFGNILKLSSYDLACYTDDFCESNYLGHFQFGKFYRGKIVHAEGVKYVMVKICEVSKIYIYKAGDNEFRLMDKVMLLRHNVVTNHPCMVKLYGYCSEDGHFGVVYDFKPFNSVFNLIPKDGFTWLERIKVALRFASLLKFLHSVKPPFRPFVVRNLDCAHIVLDKDYNPRLCDFGLITGGIFPDRTIYLCHHVLGSYGYIDIKSYHEGNKTDIFTSKQDVFAFGVILLSLISRRVYTEEDRLNNGKPIYHWAMKESITYEYNSDPDLKRPKFSLVHQSLAADSNFHPADGRKLTGLAMDCIDDDLDIRPTMKQVVRSLLKLKVMKKNVDFLGVDEVVRTCRNVL